MKNGTKALKHVPGSAKGPRRRQQVAIVAFLGTEPACHVCQSGTRHAREPLSSSQRLKGPICASFDCPGRALASPLGAARSLLGAKQGASALVLHVRRATGAERP